MMQASRGHIYNSFVIQPMLLTVLDVISRVSVVATLVTFVWVLATRTVAAGIITPSDRGRNRRATPGF